MTENLFGFEFAKRRQLEKDLVSFTQKDNQDGAINIEPAFGAQTGMYVNLEGNLRTEVDLVNAYRKMAEQAEIVIAVNEVCNDAITMNDKEDVVRINLDKVPSSISDSTKEKIKLNFEQCIKLLEFNTKGYDIFKRWYIDGRLYFHVIANKDRLKEGVLELRYIDPRNIRKVREISKKRANPNSNNRNNPLLYKTENEYYIYNEKGFGVNNKNNLSSNEQITGLKIALDSIIYIPSGLVDANGNVISYLSYALKWLNQLRSLEDAMIIYRIARAPERRIWYIDVGDMTPVKAEQYVQEVAKRHKTKLAYDPTSGKMIDAKKFSTILEDFYLPRRGVGGRGTEVETLPPGQLAGNNEDVEYFLKKLYKSLMVPYSRLDSQDTYIFANQTTEISREEMNFSKFIDQLRLKFNSLFLQALEKHLILKNITNYEDWKNVISPNIRFNYTEDIYFKELKETSIFSTRLNNLMVAEPFIGKYLSRQWAMKKILRFTDDEIEQMDKEIVDETTNPLINDPGGFITPADQENGEYRDYRDYRIPPVNRGYKRQ